MVAPTTLKSPGKRTVNIVFLIAVFNEILIEALGNVSGINAGLDLLCRPVIGFTAELRNILALTFQLAQADGIADSGGVAVDLGRQILLGNT